MKVGTTLLLVWMLLCVATAPANAQKVYEDYVDGKIFLKVKDEAHVMLPEFKKRGSQTQVGYPILEQLIEEFDIMKVERPFRDMGTIAFENTYQIDFGKAKNIDELLAAISKHEAVEYVERVPAMTQQYTPNDPAINNGEQWYLNKIKAFQAWDLDKGNSNVVVAIVDDAVLMTHEEIKTQLWVNPNEIPNNGKDDDNNGYIDDVNGVDLGDGDGNASPPSAATVSNFSHGTHIACTAAGATDNGVGSASVGFNVSIMPIKCVKNSTTNSSLIQYGWQGFQYAVNNDADVINLSWGGTGYSATYENMVNEAKAQGIVVVSAAGNSGTSTPFYPAAYASVIGVGATKSNDEKASFSNYGTWVDIMAPGSQIRASIATGNNAYAFKSGTSMATPIVVGACALLKSYNPSLSADAIITAIYSTADNINAANPTLQGKIGHGRLNLYKAMQAVMPDGCLSPYEMAVSSAGGTSAVLSWANISSANSYSVRIRKVGTSSWTTKSSNSASYTFSDLEPCQDYELQAIANCSGGDQSNYSASQFFTSSPSGASGYCDVIGKTATFEWIAGVKVGDLNNTSDSDFGYGDYLCQMANMIQGNNYSFILTPGHAGSPYPEQWNIWIDLNQDGDFKDTGENVFSQTSPNTGNVNGAITIPNSAKDGTTRMRVAMKWVGVGDTDAPGHCGEFAYGEVEDYSVNIGDVTTPTTPTTTCSIPSSPAASNITNTSAMIAWNSVSSASGYTLQYKLSSSSSWKTSTTSNKYKNLTNLNEGASYQFKVKANCGSTSSNYTSTKSFTTSAPNCPLPSGLSISNVQESSVKMSWSGIGSANEYNIRYKPTNSNSWTNKSTTGTFYNASNLMAGVTCEFQVQAECSANNSTFSASKTFTTSNAPCNTPSGLTTSSITQNKITIKWNNVSGSNSYTVQYRKKGTSSWSTTSSTSTSKAISNLQQNNQYEFKVKTNCSSGSSSYSSTQTYMTSATPCGTPSNLSTSNIGTNNATLKWGSVSGVSNYSVQYRKQGSSSWNTTSSTSTSKSLSGLSAGTSYQFKVKANCTSNSGSYSSTKSFGTQSPTCSIPSNLSTSNITTNSARLNWSSTSGASNYSIQYRKTGSSSWSTTTSSTTYKNLSNLSTGASYEFKVRSNCSSNSSSYSSTKPFNIQSLTCSTPTGLSTSSVTTNSAKMSIAGVSGATLYYYRYRKVGTSSWTQVTSSSTYKSIYNLTASTSYQFQVKTACTGGSQSSYSATKTFITDGNTCNTPANLSASNITSSGAKVQWGTVSGASSYIVKYKKAGTNTWVSQSSTGNSRTLTSLATNASYEFKVQTKCTSGATSSYSSTKTFSTTGGTTTPSNNGDYCASKGYNANNEWIQSVKLGSINNNSGSDGGYGDHTNKSATLNSGQSYSITLTPGYKGSAYYEYWNVWIDLNQNSKFDSNELVYTSATGKKNVVSGSLQIPSNATAGATRMRVSMQYKNAASPCQQFTYGEVEDYTINIAGGTTTTPTTAQYCVAKATKATSEWIKLVQLNTINNSSGSNGGYGDYTNKSTDLSAGQSYPIKLEPGFKSSAYNEYFKVYIDFNGDGDFNDANETALDPQVAKKTAVNGSITVPANAKVGATRMRVTMQYKNPAAACGTYSYGEVEDYTVNIKAGSGGNSNTPAAQYCVGRGKNATSEWIAGVQIGTFSNTSGSNGGYGNFISKKINLGIGEDYNVQLTPGFKGSAYKEYWRIWVDLNGDGDFNDANEKVFDSKASSKTAITGTLSIPANATEGEVRMRVAMKYGTGANPCDEYSYGEVEDYTANLAFGVTVQAVEEEQTCGMNIAFEYKVDGLNVRFNNSFEGEYDEIFWNFGDGGYSEKENPDYTYTSNGDYFFSVTLYNAKTACMQTFEGFVHVFAEEEILIDTGGIESPNNDLPNQSNVEEQSKDKTQPANGNGNQ